MITQYSVGDVIELVRRPVDVVPSHIYREVGIRSFGKGIFHKEPITGAELGSKRVFYIQAGDLIFSNVFAWEGAVAIASEAEDGFIGSHRFMTYRVNEEVANCRYLVRYFTSGPGLEIVRRASPGSAGRNKTLGIQSFARQTIELPDLDEQRRIAEKLDALLGQTAKLDETSKFADRDLTEALATTGVDSILTRWSESCVSVRKVCDLVNDLVRPGEDPGPAKEFVGLEHIAPHLGMRRGARSVGDEKGRKFRFASGDILYGYLRPYLNKVWVADRHGLCSVEQYVLRPNGIMPGELIAYGLRSRRVFDQVVGLTNNLQLPRLRSGLLLGLEIPLVSPEHQEEASAELDGFLQEIRQYAGWQRCRDELVAALRPSLLNAAFSGQF